MRGHTRAPHPYSPSSFRLKNQRRAKSRRLRRIQVTGAACRRSGTPRTHISYPHIIPHDRTLLPRKYVAAAPSTPALSHAFCLAPD